MEAAGGVGGGATGFSPSSRSRALPITPRIGRAGGTKAGFTLIELLVVIAIIAILAAILFPVFLTARESGRQARCASNLRQWGYAFQMYFNDYNRLPPAIWL